MPEEEVESGSRTVGELLQRAREGKGVSLDEASHVTKIGRNYLAAIEAGDFQKLPNPAYLKGFLRLYATYLGLSGDEILTRYQECLPKAPPAESHPDASPMSVERVRFVGRRRWAIPLVLLGLVIIAALIFSEGEEKKGRVVPQPAPQPPPVALPAVNPVQSRASSPRNPSPTSLPGGPAQAPSASEVQAPAPAAAGPAPAPVREGPRPGGVILKLRFNQDTWLGITIDGAISQRYDLKAGDIIEWKGTHGFTLDLGDGGAVEGEFNGKPLKPLGEKGKPAHVELKGE